MVVFDGTFNVAQNNVIANGGVAQKESDSGCGNGAAGTVYRVDEDSLIIDNRGIKVESATGVTIPEWRQHNSEKGISELAKSLTVQGRARLIIKGEHFGLTFNDVFVYDNSMIEFGQQKDTLHVRFLGEAHIAKNSILDFTRTENAFIYQGTPFGEWAEYANNTVLTIGQTFFRKRLGIRAVNVNIVGNVTYPEFIP